jgi:hypothetical protein
VRKIYNQEHFFLVGGIPKSKVRALLRFPSWSFPCYLSLIKNNHGTTKHLQEKCFFWLNMTVQYVLLANELFSRTVTSMANKDPEFITLQAWLERVGFQISVTLHYIYWLFASNILSATLLPWNVFQSLGWLTLINYNFALMFSSFVLWVSSSNVDRIICLAGDHARETFHFTVVLLFFHLWQYLQFNIDDLILTSISTLILDCCMAWKSNNVLTCYNKIVTYWLEHRKLLKPPTMIELQAPDSQSWKKQNKK